MFQPPSDVNAKDSTCNNKRYFAKQCRIQVRESKKCLAADGYLNRKEGQSAFALRTVPCDQQYRAKDQIFNIRNVNCEFVQDNHVVKGSPTDPSNPAAPQCD
jgi:hypothetical protein